MHSFNILNYTFEKPKPIPAQDWNPSTIRPKHWRLISVASNKQVLGWISCSSSTEDLSVWFDSCA